eukprot:4394450-Amphidinium_carterae.1
MRKGWVLVCQWATLRFCIPGASWFSGGGGSNAVQFDLPLGRIIHRLKEASSCFTTAQIKAYLSACKDLGKLVSQGASTEQVATRLQVEAGRLGISANLTGTAPVVRVAPCCVGAYLTLSKRVFKDSWQTVKKKSKSK